MEEWCIFPDPIDTDQKSSCDVLSCFGGWTWPGNEAWIRGTGMLAWYKLSKNRQWCKYLCITSFFAVEYPQLMDIWVSPCGPIWINHKSCNFSIWREKSEINLNKHDYVDSLWVTLTSWICASSSLWFLPCLIPCFYRHIHKRRHQVEAENWWTDLELVTYSILSRVMTIIWVMTLAASSRKENSNQQSHREALMQCAWEPKNWL